MTILYKYTNLDGAFAMIENNSIGFTCAENLNDPFELRGASYRKKGVDLNGTNGAVYNFSRKLGILSLTRNHLNPIMWSLYANQHRGAVVAFDVEKAGFNQASIIPASKGGVIYTKTHPGNIFYSETGDYSDIYEMCKKHDYSELSEKEKSAVSMFFLYKSACWSHEEEVRVVKNIEKSGSHHLEEVKEYENRSGNWTKIRVDNRPLHCLTIPNGAITQIYVGACLQSLVKRENGEHQMAIKRLKGTGLPVSSVKRKDDSWDLVDGYFYDENGELNIHRRAGS